MVLPPLKSPKVPSRLRGTGKGYALMYMSIEIADHLKQMKNPKPSKFHFERPLFKFFNNILTIIQFLKDIYFLKCTSISKVLAQS